jgi:hypothetical protein
MSVNVFDMLFGCWHKNYSFPMTAKKANKNHSHAASVTGTYVVCLDCGKEFPCFPLSPSALNRFRSLPSQSPALLRPPDPHSAGIRADVK